MDINRKLVKQVQKKLEPSEKINAKWLEGFHLRASCALSLGIGREQGLYNDPRRGGGCPASGGRKGCLAGGKKVACEGPSPLPQIDLMQNEEMGVSPGIRKIRPLADPQRLRAGPPDRGDGVPSAMGTALALRPSFSAMRASLEVWSASSSSLGSRIGCQRVTRFLGGKE